MRDTEKVVLPVRTIVSRPSGQKAVVSCIPVLLTEKDKEALKKYLSGFTIVKRPS